MLSWRECVLYNWVIRSATVVVLDMVAVTHIIKPQRASIFGEYTHMQLMPCLQSYMTEYMSYFGSLVKSFSGWQLICITSLTTNADLVLSNKPTDMTALSPCQQEEADTRMMLHLYHAAGQGHSKAFLRTMGISHYEHVPEYHRTCFSQFRMSAHRLRVEMGRWQRIPHDQSVVVTMEVSRMNDMW